MLLNGSLSSSSCCCILLIELPSSVALLTSDPTFKSIVVILDYYSDRSYSSLLIGARFAEVVEAVKL